MNQTTLANLALSKLGSFEIKNLEDTSSKEARVVALHYKPVLREVLRAHWWSFARRAVPLVAVDARAYLDVSGPLKVAGAAVGFRRLYQLANLTLGRVAYAEDDIEDEVTPSSGAAWDGSGWVLAHGGTGASWRRPLDVADPSLVELRPALPRNSAVTALAADNNDLRFEQVNQAGPTPSVEYAAPSLRDAVGVEVNGSAILIRPRAETTDARYLLTMTGYTSINGNSQTGNDTYTFFALDGSGNRVWHDTTATAGDSGFTSRNRIWWDAGYWYFSKRSAIDYAFGNDTQPPGIWRAAAADPKVTFPDGLTFQPFANCTGDVTMTATPVTFTASTASQVKAAIQATPAAAALVTVSLAPGSDGTGAVFAMPRLPLAGGVAGRPVIRRIAPADEMGGWAGAFELPADFLRARSLHPAGAAAAILCDLGHRSIDRFAMRRVAGRNCVLVNADAVSLEYVAEVDEPDQFDPLFVSAFVTRLAAAVARRITGSDDMELALMAAYKRELLPEARAADSQETESGENHPLREFLDGALINERGDFF